MVLRTMAVLTALLGLPMSGALAVTAEDIFSTANASRLCQDGVVSKLELADIIRGLSGVPISRLATANFDGQPYSGGLEASMIRFASVERPFGDNKPVPREFVEPINKRNDIILSIHYFFKDGGNKSYKVTPKGADAFEYFTATSATKIECAGKKKDEGGGGGSGGPGGAPAQKDSGKSLGKEISDRVVIRKTIADLTVPKEKLKKANGALFSYKNDDYNNSTTYSVEGLIGAVIAGSSVDRVDKLKGGAVEESYWFNLTPYFYYKHTDVTPDTKSAQDIDVMQPGMSGNLTWVSSTGTLAFDLQADTNYIIDRAQDSRLVTSTLRLAPSLLVDGLIIMRAPIEYGMLRIRPDVALLAREYYVESQGTNPQLKGKSSFSSFGVDSSLKISMRTEDKILSGFEFAIGYLYLANTNDVDDIGFLTGTLSYSPPNLENLSLDLTYSKGRDERTLQKEREWLAGLAVRY